jgi:predicted ATPase
VSTVGSDLTVFVPGADALRSFHRLPGATMGLPRHLERYDWEPARDVDRSAWPFDIPAVAQLIADDGFEVPPGITFLVGENGSGKSTLIEAFAAAYPRHGAESASPIRVTGPRLSDEDSPLHFHLRARTHRLAAPGGFFLRAEVMHEYLAEIDLSPADLRAWGGERVQSRSHGETFLSVLAHRFADRGVYFLDEPEAALSFRSCLALMMVLETLRQEGSQAIIATHSPLVSALPGATTFELGEWGIRRASWDELDVVANWRDFLASPGRWLRHVVDTSE